MNYLSGQRLCPVNKTNVPGQGTYEELGYIYSKFAGIVNVEKKEEVSYFKLVTEFDNLFLFINNFIFQICTIEVHGMTDQSIVPAPGDIVTAMVTIVNQRFCKCTIKCIGDIVLSRPYRGIVRREDVRATEKDRIEMYKSFRPGDIILARVVSFI